MLRSHSSILLLVVLLLLVSLLQKSNASSKFSSPILDCIKAHLLPSAILALPGSKLYNDTVTIDNKRAVVYPVAVVFPSSDSDVASALTASASCDLDFSVVAGGHSAQGYGLARGGLTVNIRSMNTTTFLTTPSGVPAVRIGAGARFAEVYDILDAVGKNQMVVGGGCPQVGLGGFVLGGGWSFLSRSFGLAIDTLEELTMVLPNRSIVTLGPSHPDQDLWWALRGGGGGNFGIVTSFTLRLVEPNPQPSVGEMCWSPFDPVVLTLMEAWIDRWADAPSWLLFDPCWLPIGPNKSRMFCFTVVCNAGPEQCGPFLSDARAQKPILDTVKVQPYVAWSRANSGVTSAQEGYLYLQSYFFQPGRFTVETVSVLQSALKSAPSPRNLVLFHVSGGEVNSVPSNATAFWHRDDMILLQIKAIWDHPEEEAANRRWIESVKAKVYANTTGSYVNYIDRDLQDWQTAYYGSNYPKLLTVKHRVDPTNMFHFNQSIGAS